MSRLVTRRRLGRGALGAAFAAGLAPAARAQDFPNRPVRLVVPFAPGGGVDAVARIIADPLGAALGQPVVVENRAGAGGAIGVDAVAKSPPDGYALTMVSPGNMTAGPVVRPTPYDPLSLGFVTMIARSPLLLITRNGFRAQNLRDFVALVRREPDAVRFASAGVGTSTHLAVELLNLRLGVRIAHVPYRGTGPALTDMLAGNVDVFFSDASAWPMVQQGQLRLLAVSSAARWESSPQTPAVNDAVPGFDISNWYGVVAPPGTPEPIRARLAQEIAKIIVRPEVTETLHRIGFQPAPMSPADFAVFVRTELETWRTVVRAANIRVD
jgi:tripartite-type tricarboxylate transporter receptor subunit TctC